MKFLPCSESSLVIWTISDCARHNNCCHACSRCLSFLMPCQATVHLHMLAEVRVVLCAAIHSLNAARNRKPLRKKLPQFHKPSASPTCTPEIGASGGKENFSEGQSSMSIILNPARSCSSAAARQLQGVYCPQKGRLFSGIQQSHLGET